MIKKQFSEQTINKIYNLLKKDFNDTWADAFDNAPDKAAWLIRNRDILETSNKWNNNFKIEDLLKPNKSAMESIYNTYRNIDDISDERMKQFSNAYDITKEYLRDYYAMRNRQAAEENMENQVRWNELDKNRQEAERANDDSYYNTPVANEYARKHYIQDRPYQAAVNEVAGKAASIFDFAPPGFSLAGPIIRTVQKWAADEPWATKGTLADFGGSALGFLGKVPGVKQAIQGTTGKIANLLTRSKNKKAQEIANVINKKAIAEEEALARQELANLKQVGDLDKLGQDELYQLYNATSDPVLKANIEKVHKARQELEAARVIEGNSRVAHNNAAANKAADEVLLKDAALEEANNTVLKNMADYESFLQAKSGNISFSPYGDIPAFYKDVPLEVVAEQYARKQQPSFISKALGEGILGIGRKTTGQTVAHRNWDEINYKPDYNEDKAVDEVIRMYSNDWSLNRTPVNYDNPLIKAAYDKWFSKAQYDLNILNKLEQ